MKQDFPILNLISYPTPIQELTRLQKALSCQKRLFIKRDDLTEMGLGGNKTRKLEYVMADALAQGADTVITWGGVQSNHCRQTLAYAKRLGMDCHLVLNGQDERPRQGNLLIFDLFGAALHFQADEAKCPADCQELAQALRKAGKRPYVIGLGASNPLGTLGYIRCAQEIARAQNQLGVSFTDLFVATGSGGTQAGLELGQRRYLPGCRVHGVAVGTENPAQQQRVARLMEETAAFLQIPLAVSPEEIWVDDTQIGPGYAQATQQGIEAIRLLGRTEGILMDPVYTGKALAGMLRALEAQDSPGVWLFIHTGGGPAVFDFAEAFA